jgi:hypothetical protein
MSERETRGGGTRIGRGRVLGARGPSWAGPGRARLGRAGSDWVVSRDQKPTTRTTTNQNPIANRNPKRDETNTRFITTSDKRNMLRHDATPMST